MTCIVYSQFYLGSTSPCCDQTLQCQLISHAEQLWGEWGMGQPWAVADMVQDRSGCSQARLYPRIGTHHYTVTQCRADSTGTYHYLCYYVHLILQWPAVTIVQTVQGLYIICVLCIPFVTVFSWYCSGLQSPVQTVQGLTNHSPQLW